MNTPKIFESEYRFCLIMWENEPVSSGDVVKMAEQSLGWKKSTTFTVLRRLCEKGLFRNENGTVTSVISKQDFYSMQSEQFIDETFGGSLPAFLAAFTKRKKLTEAEIAELRRMVNDYKED